MRLHRYLRPDLILTDLEGENVEAVIAALSAHLGSHLDGVDRDGIERGLLEREASHTTSMGQGVAIPHATIEGIDAPVLMVARAREPVQFGPGDSDPVSIFFVLLSPPNREREHIKLLARICRFVRHPGFLDDLGAAGDASELLAAVERADEKHV